VLAGSALAAPLVASLILAFASGGYFITAWGTAALALIGILVLTVIGTRGGLAGVAGAVSLAGWAGLLLWQLTSAGWANEPAASQQAMGQTALYAAVFTMGLLGLRRAAWLPWLGAGALFATWVPVTIALASRLLPGQIGEDPYARLSWPISYWNGLGALAGFGLVLAIGLASSPRLDAGIRIAAAAVTPVFGLGLYLTLSRGAIVVVGLVLIALILIGPSRIETIAVTAVCLGVSTTVCAFAEQQGNLVALAGELGDHVAQGRRVGLALLLAMVVCGVLAWGAVQGISRLAGRPRQATGAVIAALVVLLVAGGWITRGPDQNPVSWADQQFQEFKAFAPSQRTDDSVASRLAVAASSGRWQTWSTAVDQWRSEPITGTGAGDYRFEWNENRTIDLYLVNAHSLYLEVMAESGLIGLLLLVTPLGIALLAVTLVRVRHAAHPHTRDVVVAACAASVLAVHAAGDWDWQLPAIMLPAVILGAGALKASTEILRWDRPAGWWVRGGTVAVAAIAGLLLVGQVGSAALTDTGKAQARQGNLEKALQNARDAQALQGNAPAPRLLEAYILTDLGRHREADAAFAAALARSPRDWSVMSDWAAALINRGDRAAAVPLLRRAERLNPKETRVDVLRGLLTK